MKKFFIDKIENIMIERAFVSENGIATVSLSSGEKAIFYCGRKIENLPKKLKETDPTFYNRLQDEIFDELHPF